MDCKRAAMLLEAYLDNELDRAEARELERHVDGCAQCRAELARVGGRPAAAEALTAAEEAVARLVADGSSNKEVAATLSISPRTVEVHLGHIFRKMGIRSRGQLASRLR